MHVKLYLKSYETSFVKVLGKGSAPLDRVVHMYVWFLVELKLFSHARKILLKTLRKFPCVQKFLNVSEFFVSACEDFLSLT